MFAYTYTHSGNKIRQQYSQHPESFESWPILVFWRLGVTIDFHIDAFMHLIFIGIVKKTFGIVAIWVEV